eukprot:COSAG06_NODE_22054_length_735_cov_2.512579_1_plen_45_part_10
MVPCTGGVANGATHWLAVALAAAPTTRCAPLLHDEPADKAEGKVQ